MIRNVHLLSVQLSVCADQFDEVIGWLSADRTDLRACLDSLSTGYAALVSTHPDGLQFLEVVKAHRTSWLLSWRLL